MTIWDLNERLFLSTSVPSHKGSPDQILKEPYLVWEARIVDGETISKQRKHYVEA